MSRPGRPAGREYTRRVPIQARPEQVERWQLAAARAGLSLSEWLRGLADAAAPRRGPEGLARRFPIGPRADDGD